MCSSKKTTDFQEEHGCMSAVAKDHLDWHSENWAKQSVLWSDESKFNIFGSDGKKCVGA